MSSVTTQECLDARRNELFRRMGRNLWLYQQVEAQLKVLLTASSFAVPPAPADPEAALRARTESLSKKTMGTLVSYATVSVLATEASLEHAPVKEDWLTFSARWDASADFAEDLHQQLKVLVAERNQLAHCIINRWNIESLDCMVLGLGELDEQRERIVAVHQTLRRIGEHLLEAAQAMANYIASPEFKVEWRRHHLEACLMDVVARAARADGWTPLSHAGQLFVEHRNRLSAEHRKGLPGLNRMLVDSQLFDMKDEVIPGGGQRTLARLKSLSAPTTSATP